MIFKFEATECSMTHLKRLYVTVDGIEYKTEYLHGDDAAELAATLREVAECLDEQAARTPAADSSAPLGYISQMDIDDLSAYARIAVLTKAKTESQSIPVYLAAPVADSSAGASGDWDNVPTIAFEDARVQRVYNLLCHGVTPPEGEHWEGYTARIIVEALAAPVAVDSSARDAWSKETLDDLHKFIYQAVGGGYEFDGVDAADLYFKLFPGNTDMQWSD